LPAGQAPRAARRVDGAHQLLDQVAIMRFQRHAAAPPAANLAV
jgi:hypothetical protein